MPDQNSGRRDGASARVFDASMQALQSILGWLNDHSRRHPKRDPTILVGGWAVYLHNDWEKSRDIDLVVSRSVRKSLENYLVDDLDFEKEPRRAGLRERVVKKLDGSGEEIWLDFAGFEDMDSYEGYPDVEIGYQDAADHCENHDLEGTPVQIPDRTQLIIYKTKAAWDRSYRLENNTSDDRVYDRGKLAKDYGDILALLDDTSSRAPPVSTRRLAQAIDHAPFTYQVWNRLAEQSELRSRYPRKDPADSRVLVQHLLDALADDPGF